MNTYKFEYDTAERNNAKVEYKTKTFTEAVRKFRKNCKTAWNILDIKENGKSMLCLFAGIELRCFGA